MNANFKYTTMTITGAMHLAIGILCIIFSIVGFAVRAYESYEYDSIHGRYNDYIRTYPSKGTAAGSFITSLWVSIDVVCDSCMLIKNVLIHLTLLIVNIGEKSFYWLSWFFFICYKVPTLPFWMLGKS